VAGEREVLGPDVGIVVTLDDAGENEAGGNENENENGGVDWVVTPEGAADGLPSSPWTETKARYSVRNLIVVLQMDLWYAWSVEC
jgi:hypothetical protein